MEYFKDLYEQAIEATFSGKLHRMLYENELTEKPLSSENVEAFRNLFRRYTDLRKLGDKEFVEVGFRDRMYALNERKASDDGQNDIEAASIQFTKIMDVIHDMNADLPYICTRCCSELWESTKYCPHCGRLNIEFKEENSNG